MKTTTSACQQTTLLTEHFKAQLPHLRIDTIQRFIDVMMAMITAQSVNFHDLSANMPGESSLEAKKQRVKRTLTDEQVTMMVLMPLIIAQLPPGKLLMSLDRTTWQHGSTPVNYVVLGAVVQGLTIPLIWIALDHTGNSHTYDRMWLVLCLLKALPAKRWRGLVADREFIGAQWFRFLRRRGIRRAIRIKQDTNLDDLRADEWFDDLAIGAFRVISEKVCVYGELMRVVATKSPSGDLVIIATDFSVHET